MNDPLMAIGYAVVAAVVFYLWNEDRRRGRSGESGGFPGAVAAPVGAVVIATLGALLLTGAETAGEIALGLDAEQSELAAIAILALLGAGIIEEVVFRGYLFPGGRGRFFLWGGIFVLSAVFAVIHPHLWSWEGGFRMDFWNAIDFHLTPKAWFTTAFLFLHSVWFYLARFCFGNRQRSLLPCFVAHAASNGAVYVIKWWQGFIV